MVSWIVFISFCHVALAVQHFHGYKVYEVIVTDEAASTFLRQLSQRGEFDFWTHPTAGKPVDIMTSPAAENRLLDLFQQNDIHYRIKIPDVQNLIDTSQGEPRAPSLRYNLTWDDYYRLNEIYNFYQELQDKYPNLVSVSQVGTSYQGRPILMLRISSKPNTTNAIFIDGGIHAREWITPATATYVVRELVENYSNHPELVDNFAWYILPVINPDGYEYTHTTNRMWRKSRQPTSDPNCVGTDLNRNFDFHWDDPVSSTDPCSETYRGSTAFSESEARAVRDAINSIPEQLQLYLSFHSYGQSWLTSWGWTSDLPNDYQELQALAEIGVNALTAVHGSLFTISPPGGSTGCSHDWVKGVAGIQYTYALELRDEGEYGFLLPASQIIPTGQETWEGVRAVATALLNK